MTTFSRELEEHALDLAWSLWAELGVAGWVRRHTVHAIDPEPLILFTAMLADRDPRLRDESTDWCIRYGRFVATTRLRNLLSEELPGVRAAFGEFAATVNVHGGLRWPEATEPRPYEPTRRARLEDFRPPSLITLRLRALFGTSARAEIIRMFLASPSQPLTAAELVPGVGHTKRNVAVALDALRMGGVLESSPTRNQLPYRLARPRELRAAVGKFPAYFPRWTAIFRTLSALIEFAPKSESKPIVRAIEARSVLRDLSRELELAAVQRPSDEPAGEAFWPVFEQWARRLVAGWSSADPDFF